MGRGEQQGESKGEVEGESQPAPQRSDMTIFKLNNGHFIKAYKESTTQQYSICEAPLQGLVYSLLKSVCKTNVVVELDCFTNAATDLKLLSIRIHILQVLPR